MLINTVISCCRSIDKQRIHTFTINGIWHRRKVSYLAQTVNKPHNTRYSMRILWEIKHKVHANGISTPLGYR